MAMSFWWSVRNDRENSGANRGEIAIRVMRACREMAVKSVAVYSDADKDALFVKYADEAYYLGASPASQSYLNIDRIMHVVRKVVPMQYIPDMVFSRRTLILPTPVK